MGPLSISQTSVHQYDGHVVLQEWASGLGSKSERQRSFYDDIYRRESRDEKHAYLLNAIMCYF